MTARPAFTPNTEGDPSVHMRYCGVCRRWEVDMGPPRGWMPARRAAGLGPHQEAQARSCYRARREAAA